MSKRRKGHAHKLRRRYGHFKMQDVKDATAKLARVTKAHPAVAAAAIGAATGAVAGGMGAGGAAIIGAAAGIAVQQSTKHGG